MVFYEELKYNGTERKCSTCTLMACKSNQICK